jgi:ferredoxin
MSHTLTPDLLQRCQSPRATSGEFEVVAARSGKTVTVRPEQSVLQVLLDAGVAVSYSCTDGICGTCLTPVMAGEPEHWDSFQEPEEQAANTHMTPCCSRSSSACLVLDI